MSDGLSQLAQYIDCWKENIGRNIRWARMEKDISKERLAKGICTLTHELDAMEAGQTAPRLDQLIDISCALDVSMSRLLYVEVEDISEQENTKGHKVRTVNEIKSLGWPMALLHQIFETSIPALPNVEESIEYLLSFFSERKRDIILLRYRDALSLKQIAKQFNRTPEAVRQSIHYVERHMRKPENKKILIMGIYRYNLEACRGSAQLEQQSQNDIESLNLSSRAFWGLHRKGILTVGQLTQFSEETLSAIPNIGRKSVEEIIAALAARGLTLRDHREVRFDVVVTGESDIFCLDISKRAEDALRRQNITTISELIQYSAWDLLALPSIGKKTVEEIEKALATHGMSLQSTDPDGPFYFKSTDWT